LRRGLQSFRGTWDGTAGEALLNGLPWQAAFAAGARATIRMPDDRL
jgi:hypothetical protein